MQSTIEIWNSLEIVKLVVGVLTPITVAGFGWFISRKLKHLELSQWSNQKLIEKRLSFYDSVAPQLNRLLCFYTWVGNWKDISPNDALKTKRELDQSMNIYRHLFDDDVYDSYQSFIHTLFQTFQGAGEDAKIVSVISGPDGNRSAHCSYAWQPSWNSSFSADTKVASKAEVWEKYSAVMNALRRSLGAQQ